MIMSTGKQRNHLTVSSYCFSHAISPAMVIKLSENLDEDNKDCDIYDEITPGETKTLPTLPINNLEMSGIVADMVRIKLGWKKLNLILQENYLKRINFGVVEQRRQFQSRTDEAKIRRVSFAASDKKLFQ